MQVRYEAPRSDLEILGYPPDRHATDVAIWTVGSIITALVALVMVTAILRVSPPVGIMVAGAVVYIGSHEPARRVIIRARNRRKELEHAFAAFLDLVNILLAGGAGVESAFIAAGDAGDGWCFELFRELMADARAERLDLWCKFRDVGLTCEVDALVDVANSLQLAGQHGARIRQSLSAKATSLRVRSMAQIEHDAAQQTERMGVPMVLLFMGFIVLLGYPAYANTLGVLA
ncbi:MAG: type II secretion system F family protein [Ilumatobacteraceae bacterium]|nr:type II secretion system F family protein [Ilumatobacteraceae bacterium]